MVYENIFKSELLKKLKEISFLKNLDINIESPKDFNNGDFSLPCFSFSKTLGKAPNIIANEVTDCFESDVFDCEAAGPFVNFKVKSDKLIDFLDINNSLKNIKNLGNNEKVLIEYSSPNTNKSQHLGHLRNNLLGVALKNIFKEAGFNVVTSCIFNDKGTAMAKTIFGALKFNANDLNKTAEEIQNEYNIKSDKFVADIYVKASQFEKENPESTEEINEINRKWEAEDPEIRKVWKILVDWVMFGYKKTYERLGCDFDYPYYESDFYKKGKEMAEYALEKGVLRNGDNGAVVTDFEKYNLPDTVVVKSDGTSLYITQDIYLAKLRNEEINPDKVVYVVANEQNLHFKQLFALLDQLNIGKREDYFHLNYGYVTLPTGRMKSREGTVVDADDLMDEVVSESKSEDIGIGAIKFQFLKVDAFSDFVFDPVKSIELTGDTSVYIQYVYARINSLIEKSGKDNFEFNLDNLKIKKEEIDLMRQLAFFADSISKVIETYSPSHLCKKLLDIANAYNSFYSKCRILDLEDDNLKNFRLALSKATAEYIKFGLNLLGINIVEKM